MDQTNEFVEPKKELSNAEKLKHLKIAGGALERFGKIVDTVHERIVRGESPPEDAHAPR